MKFSTSAVIAAPRERVFAALVDPTILVRAIPGCEELTPEGPEGPGGNVTYRAKVKVGMAGLHGVYGGVASIRDRMPPDSFTLVFDGKGAPGFARGTASIRLTDETPQSTRVACEADVQVGGVIAAVGSRLIDAAGRKLADDFFRRLTAEVSATLLIDRLR